MNPCCWAVLDSYLSNVEGQCDGIKEVGVGTGKRKERGGGGREPRRRGHGAGRVGEG